MAHSSLNQNTAKDTYVIPLHQSVGQTLDLHIYVDRSLIEVYIGKYAVCTLRVYPTHAAQSYALQATGTVNVNELIVRTMGL